MNRCQIDFLSMFGKIISYSFRQIADRMQHAPLRGQTSLLGWVLLRLDVDGVPLGDVGYFHQHLGQTGVRVHVSRNLRRGQLGHLGNGQFRQ